MLRSRQSALAAILLLAASTAPAAQQHNWSGCHFGPPICTAENRTPAWTDDRNWFEGAPHAGAGIADDLVFANATLQAATINTFPANTRFRSITIGAPHQLFGEAITLDAGISASITSVIQLSISLNARQTFSVSTAGASLVFQGPSINTNGHILDVAGAGNIVMVSPLSGSNSLIKQGIGTLQFVGNQPYTGLIEAREGIVRISGTHLGGIFVEGGRLEGAGTVQGISSSEGLPDFVVAPGGTSPNETAIINAVGNVTFHGTGTFAVDLKGTTAGSGYDQLNVTGTVRIVSSSQLAQLAVTLVNFTPAPGDSFVIVNNAGTDPIEGSVTVPGEFLGRAEGSSFIVGNTTFFITYRGGDGNDIVLHVPTTRTWDGGGGNNNWSTAANWVGDIVPQVGDDLVFPPGAARLANTNDLVAGMLFNSITFSGPNYFLFGNAIALRSGIVNNAPSGNSVVDVASILLDADQSFTQNTPSSLFVQCPIATNGKRLSVQNTTQGTPLVVLADTISGTGGLTIGPTAACRLDGGGSNPKVNTYTGPTIMNGGVLIVRALQPDSDVEMSGGRLSGSGQVGAITASGGTIRALDGVATTIKVAGNLSMSSGATFSTELNNGTPIKVGRLDVAGLVELGGATLAFEDLTAANVAKVGDQFVIIANDGTDPVNGTFNGLAEGSQLVTRGRLYSITYQGGDGNDVVLQFTAEAPVGIGLTKLTNGTDNDTPPGPAVPVGSTVTFTYLVTNTESTPLQNISVRDDNGTPGFPNDDFNASFSGGDTNSNGLLDPGETFIFSASRIATEGQHTNTGEARGIVAAFGLTVTASNPDNHFGGTPPPATLANISTRLRVQGGDSALIGGVISIGSTDKRVIIRAIGPTLTNFGLPGALPDTTLELFQGNTLIASNDDWVSSSQMTEISASGLAPGNDAESAIIAFLMPNQNYTAVVRGKDGQTGVGLVEVFDLDQNGASKLANISTRGFVEVDDNVMIAGVIVAPAGTANTKVLVRALGPTLGGFGVQGFLANPALDLVGSNGTVIRSNNDWQDSQAAEIQAAQLAPSHDVEAALIESLPPGAYTAVVRGLNGTTGVGLVEVYNIP